MTDTVFYLSSDPTNGISLPIKGELTSRSYIDAGKGLTKANLVKVEIGTKVESIGDGAFYKCNSLTTLTIPDSVTSIGTRAFRNCIKLTSVTIGKSVTSIGKEAFRNCRKLRSVTIGNSVTSIGIGAFYSCKALTELTIGSSVKSIGEQAFQECKALESVTIPDSVTSIGEQAFQECKALQSVTIGNSVTSIGIYAFYKCNSLTTLTIGNSVETIGDNAFTKSGIANVKISFKLLRELGLNPNERQTFFGAENVYIEAKSFFQPGTISGNYSILNNGYNFDTGSEDVVIRLHVPEKRIYEEDRSRMLIADFTNIEKKGGTEIRDIAWQKITDDGNTWENIDGQTKRAYTLTYPKTSTRFRVSCKYTPSTKKSSFTSLSANSNPTFPLIGTQKDNIEQNVQKRDNYIEYKALNEFFNQTFTVTAKSINDENKYFIEIFQQPTLTFYNGSTYRFESSIFKIHPFKFSTTYDGKLSDGEYTTNVTNGDNYVEITIDQDTPSTLYYYCENHENMGGKIIIKSENFNNTEFRKTLTSMFYDYPTISNTRLFENESFLYENMQEVEVSKRVRSITETPFPPGTRYYIRSITKYLNPTKYSWVNDTTKQLYFYTGNTTTSLANTRDNSGIIVGCALSPFVYDSNKNSHEKCENVQYLMTSYAKNNRSTKIELSSNYYRDNKNITTIEEVKNNILWTLDYPKTKKTVIISDITDRVTTTFTRKLNKYTLLDNDVIKKTSGLEFPDGIVKFETEYNEYLRIMDITLNNKTFKIAIKSDSWGKYQTSGHTYDSYLCFPGNSQLILKDGTKKIFHDIEVGDEIQVCSKDMELSYSKVIFLPHLQNNKSTEYIKFTTTSNQTIRATALHLLPVLNKNNTLQNVIAKNITQEDKLYVLNNGKGVPEEIKTIEIIEEEGVYTCLVKEGEYIVVDNIVASPFPGDGLDESYVSKYAFSYTMLRLYAKGFSMLDSVGVLNFIAPLLRSMVFAVAKNCHF